MMKHKELLAEKSAYTTPSLETLYLSNDAVRTSGENKPTSNDPYSIDCWIDSDF